MMVVGKSNPAGLPGTLARQTDWISAPDDLPPAPEEWPGVAAKSLMLCLLGCSFIGSAQEFEAEGVIVYTGFPRGAPEIREERSFMVAVRECQWFVRTSPAGDKRGIDRFEAGYDGTYLYAVAQLQPGAEHNSAVGLIERQSVPGASGIPFESCLWLAYGSGCYLREVKDGRLVPIVHMKNPRLRDQGYAVRGQWSLALEPPSLPREVVYLSDGKIQTVDAQGNPKVLDWWPPYNNGFVFAIYKATAFTNLGSVSIPETFFFEQFAPEDKGLGTNDLRVIARLTGCLKAGRVGTSREQFVPALTGKTLVEDRRFAADAATGHSLTYEVTNGMWPSTSDPMLTTMHRRQQEAQRAVSGTASKKSRKLAGWTAFAVINLFVAFLVIRKVMIKREVNSDH